MLSSLFWRKLKDKDKTAQVKFDASILHSFLEQQCKADEI